MKKIIDINQVEQDAMQLYTDGKFYCSEAIIYSIRTHIAPDMPLEMIGAASGLGYGIGNSACACGAVTGGVITLGYFFGRSMPGTPYDDDIVRVLALANELQQHFRDLNNKVLCCYIHTKKFDVSKGEQRGQCAQFTGQMARKVAQIIVRELNLDYVD